MPETVALVSLKSLASNAPDTGSLNEIVPLNVKALLVVPGLEVSASVGTGLIPSTFKPVTRLYCGIKTV